MCIAVPGQILNINNNEATVNIMNVETVVNIQLINKPMIGDYVLIHGGCAIEKLDQEYFNDLNNIFKGILKKEKKPDE